MPTSINSPMPAVDLIIAVHSALRPIGRAVESAAAAGLPISFDNGLRITVVCHNIDTSLIRAEIAEDLRDQVRYLECTDGIPSPAGPFNAGLNAATAPYVSIMGSDDMLEPGAIADWLAVARRCDSAAVLAPERHANGAKIRTPPIRVGRKGPLDPIRDRLSYRTAPLGLIHRAEILRLKLRFSEGYKSGEDQEFSSRLYFGGGRIDYARGAGHYVVGADATDRVTGEARPIAEDFRFALELVKTEWFSELSERARAAIVTKLIRVHVFGVAGSRSRDSWTVGERTALSNVTKELVAAAQRAILPFSIADGRLLQAVLDPSTSNAELALHASARKRFGSPATLISARPTSQLSVEGPLRFMAASALL